MSQKVIRIDFAYDGTRYKGYQIQKNDPTIQGELEKALEKIYKTPVTTFAAGRTDTGVHAVHQVASYKTASPIPLLGVKKALRSLLPQDIFVYEVSEAEATFHARFSPLKRSYLYVIFNGAEPSPFSRLYSWWVPRKLSLFKLRRTLKILKGEHDFSSFTQRSEKENHIRTLYKIKVKKRKQFIFILIQGNSFLRRMIRLLVGTAVGITECKTLKPSALKTILELKNRGENPFTAAPGGGLFFYRVHFKGKDFLDTRGWGKGNVGPFKVN
ncbi:MAG: tRNA pseudouridine(38-40) synthase TruA [Spirochaetae bacterium HGW-Spirochaetae-6]|nr:MAG: tRNA pseudouridine(38-40) synthase TruA [Spirochaetae bacterium HGW-Spirochaetae-6]